MMYVRRLFAKLTNFIRHGHAEAERNREASAPGAAFGLKQLGVVAERSEVAVFVLRAPRCEPFGRGFSGPAGEQPLGERIQSVEALKMAIRVRTN